MRSFLGSWPLVMAVLVALLTRHRADPLARATSPRAGTTPEPVAATAMALGVPADCVLYAMGTPVGPGAVPSLRADVPVPGAVVELFDIGYRPCAFAIPANTSVTLTLTNTGTAVGNVVVEELGIRSEIIGQGETTTVDIIAPAGVYVFYSEPPNQREAGRAGILTVVGAGTPSDGTPTAATPNP